MMNFNHLLVTKMFNALQGQEIALAANGSHVQPGGFRRPNGMLRPGIIREDNSRLALFEKLIKQPHLCGHIVFHRGMVIHMVTP
ncbi:hypothetical protein D3C80_1532750 [compost metagenome]